MFYIGKVCWQNHWQYRTMKMPTFLAFGTLGDSTQIGSFLFVLLCPKFAKASKGGLFVP
jgi:hypothetical protein